MSAICTKFDWSNIFDEDGGYLANKKMNEFLKQRLDLIDEWAETILFFYGGAGGGKTHDVTAILIILMCIEPGHDIFCISKKRTWANTTTVSQFNQVISELGLNEIIEWNENKSVFRFTAAAKKTWISMGRFDMVDNTITIMGMDDTSRILGMNATIIMLDEFTNFTFEEYNSISYRNRKPSPYKNLIILTANPKDSTHFSKKLWFDPIDDKNKNIQANSRVIKVNPQDNPYLEKASIDRLKQFKDIDYYWYQVMYLGEWGDISDSIIFDRNKLTVKNLSMDLSQYKNAMVGVDWGFDHKCVILLVAFDEDDNLYILKEWYSDKTINKYLSNQDVIDAYQSEFAQFGCSVVGDSSEPRTINDWRAAGISIQGAAKGRDSISNGIQWLKSKRFYCNPDCSLFQFEYYNYKYKTSKDGTITRDPVRINDDTIDVCRYVTEEHRIESDYDDWVPITGSYL